MINDNLIQSACDEKWIATTYSKYLQDKSDYYYELIGMLNEVVLDDVDDAVDVYSQYTQDDLDAIAQLIKADAEQQGIILKELDSTSQEYNDFINSCAENEEIQTIITENYNNSETILSNLAYYLNPNIDYSYEFDYDYQPGDIDFTAYNTRAKTLLENRKDYCNWAENKASQFLAEKGYSLSQQENVFAVNKGYTSIKTIIKEAYINASSENDEFGKLDLHLKDVDGNELEGQDNEQHGYSFKMLVDEIKNNYTAAVAYAGGFISSLQENISDKLDTFNNYLSTKVDVAQQYVTNTTNFVKDQLMAAKNTVSTFFQNFMNMTGWNKIHSEADIPLTPDQNRLFDYTGACVEAVFDFSTAKNITAATARTVAFAAIAVTTVLSNIVMSVFQKIEKKVQRTLLNPFDLEELDNKSKSSLVDGFQYQAEYHRYIYARNAASALAVDNAMENKIGYSTICKTVFGETMNIIREWDDEWDAYGPNDSLRRRTLHFTQCFKPKAINASSVCRCAEMADDICSTTHCGRIAGQDFYALDLYKKSGESFETFEQWWITFLSLIQSYQYGSLYLTIDDSEDNFAKGYCLAAFLERSLETASSAILNYKYGWTDLYDASSDEDPYPYIRTNASVETGITSLTCYVDLIHTYAPTNLDFVKLACGYESHAYVPDLNYPDENWTFNFIPMNILSDDPNVQSSLHNDFYGIPNKVPGTELGYDSFITQLILTAWVDKQVDPLNFCFIPYTNAVDGYSDSQYRIKTDTENQAIATEFITAIATVVIIATVTLAVTMGVKKFFRNRKFKMMTKVGQIDNAMWNGKKPSARDQRKYLRYSRKLNKSSSVSAGIAGLSDLIDNTENIGSKVDAIYTQVTGASSSPLTPYLDSKDNAVNNGDDGIFVSISNRIGGQIN